MANRLYAHGSLVRAVYANKKAVKRIYRGSQIIYSNDDVYEYTQEDTQEESANLSLLPGSYKLVCIGAGGNSIGHSFLADSHWVTMAAAGGSGACISGTFSVSSPVTLSISAGLSTHKEIYGASLGASSTVSCPAIGLNVIALGGTNILGVTTVGGVYANVQSGIFAKVANCTTDGLTVDSANCFNGTTTSGTNDAYPTELTIYPRALGREILKYGLAYGVKALVGDYYDPMYRSDFTSRGLGTVGGYVKIWSL